MSIYSRCSVMAGRMMFWPPAPSASAASPRVCRLLGVSRRCCRCSGAGLTLPLARLLCSPGLAASGFSQSPRRSSPQGGLRRAPFYSATPPICSDRPSFITRHPARGLTPVMALRASSKRYRRPRRRGAGRGADRCRADARAPMRGRAHHWLFIGVTMRTGDARRRRTTALAAAGVCRIFEKVDNTESGMTCIWFELPEPPSYFYMPSKRAWF